MNRESYSAGVKAYLCRKTAYEVGLGKTPPDSMVKKCDTCCALAFFYGVTLFSRRLSRETMTLSIDNEELLEICTYIMIHHFLAKPDVRQTERGGKVKFEVSFGRDLVGHELSYMLDDEEKDFSFACVCERCPEFFVRGAFLSAGTLSDPSLDYRVEFLLKDMSGARALSDFLGEAFSPKTVKRKSDFVVYVKGNERTEELCTAMGAQKAALDIITASIEKQTMNELNRSCNCEAANMRKTVNASVQLRLAIQKLRDEGRFDMLPDDLKETALLREQHPDASLSELSRMTEGALTRSGINHRLKKIIELAEE